MLSRNLCLGFFLLFLMVIVPLSSASTSIKVKTLPYHDVYLTLVAPSDASYSVIERFKGTSNYYGDVNFSYGGTSSFDIVVDVKLAGEDVVLKRFESNYFPGDDVYLEVAPDGKTLISTPAPTAEVVAVNTSEKISNDTLDTTVSVENDTDVSIEVTNDSSENFLTNFAVFGENGVISKTVAYIIIGIIVVLALLIFAFKFGKRKRTDYGASSPKEDSVKVRKLSDFLSERKMRDSNNPALISAERKLREAEKEINKLKNKEKIDSLKKEIRRLEEGN